MAARTNKDAVLKSGRDPVDLDSPLGELSQDDAVMAPLVTDRVRHAHLHVADLEGAAAFYRDVMRVAAASRVL